MPDPPSRWARARNGALSFRNQGEVGRVVQAPADDRSVRRGRICSSGQSEAQQQGGEDVKERGDGACHR